MRTVPSRKLDSYSDGLRSSRLWPQTPVRDRFAKTGNQSFATLVAQSTLTSQYSLNIKNLPVERTSRFLEFSKIADAVELAVSKSERNDMICRISE